MTWSDCAGDRRKVAIEEWCVSSGSRQRSRPKRPERRRTARFKSRRPQYRSAPLLCYLLLLYRREQFKILHELNLPRTWYSDIILQHRCLPAVWGQQPPIFNRITFHRIIFLAHFFEKSKYNTFFEYSLMYILHSRPPPYHWILFNNFVTYLKTITCKFYIT